ncbi:MAG: hypothetical protein AABX24_00425 [Nanoarchaeota archaeon]
MACHLTYITNLQGVVVFDLLGYTNNMGVRPGDFDSIAKTRLGKLKKVFEEGITPENMVDYLSGIAEAIKYVEAALTAKGKHLDHTHGIEDVVQDIVNSEHGVTLGLRAAEPYQAQTHHGHEHHHKSEKLKRSSNNS